MPIEFVIKILLKQLKFKVLVFFFFFPVG